MFDYINTWLFTLSVMECISLVLVVLGSYFYMKAPIYRLLVINNKIFGDGTLTYIQHPIGLIAEFVWYYGVYYFVTSFMAV
ncbi:hypothetical protein 65p210 [Aeromonas phage 65]|uniref:Uncharacterized protein n=2 Tax=Ishigurovirus osborne TaxID=260149 RepID=A0A219YC52_9CAUD|nr:hypothetical protein ST65p210 [Aeromonas phage 65]ADQ53218.1 hypothetical protein 65p210 [Aeromonas phage 65]APU01594.1 hypothetical protein [Aeromonas phage 65.2]